LPARAGPLVEFGPKTLLSKRVTIELLFRDVPALASYFVVDPSDKAGWIKFGGAKVQFAETVVPTLDDQYFEVFRPIFDFVRSKV
jgi:hypothetical protein